MTSIYDIMLGGTTDAERMKEAARQLRGQQVMGTLGMLTGDPVLGQIGSGMIGQTQQQLKGLMQAQEAARRRQQQQQEFQGLQQWRQAQQAQWAAENALAREKMEGLTMTPGMGPVYRPYAEEGERWQLPPGYEEHVEAKRQHELQKEEMKANLRAEAAALKKLTMPESTWVKVSDGLAWVDTLASTIPQVEALADVAQPGKDVMADFAKKAGLEGPARLVEPAYRGKEARSVRTTIKNVINKLRAGDFGAALTRYEGGEFGDVDPLAAGLTQDAMVQRLKDMVSFLRTVAKQKIAGRQPPGGAPLPEFLVTGWDWEKEGLDLQPAQTQPLMLEAPGPQYTRGMIPKGTRTTTDPITGREVTVTPDGRMWEMD